MSLIIRSMYQNWICHCIKMLNFHLLYISMPKGESRTEKPSSSHCHLHPFKCPILLTLPCLTPVSRGSSLPFAWHSWAKQQGEAAALSLLPMDDGESSLVPSHQAVGSWWFSKTVTALLEAGGMHVECGWKGVRRSAWKPVCVCSDLALLWSIILIKAYFVLHIVDRAFQRKALSKPQASANSNCFCSECF